MTELLMMRGLPGSGKTTFAKDWARADSDRIRVSRDDMRAMFTGKSDKQTCDFELEEIITDALHGVARDALRAGCAVVVDETNLRRKFVRQWVNLAAAEGATVTDCPIDCGVEAAVARDAAREHSVGEWTIRDMHARFLRQGFPELPEPDTQVFRPYVPNVRNPAAWVFDIDGTLALRGDRSPYDETRVREDTLNAPVALTLDALRKMWPEDKFILVSGRSDDCREATRAWCRDFLGFEPAMLLMRRAGDKRRDSVVKSELFDAHIAPHYNVHAVFDDRQQVVDMWRDKGVTCFQVAPGDF